MQAASASRQKQRRLCFSNSQGALALTSHILVAKRKEINKKAYRRLQYSHTKLSFLYTSTMSYNFTRELPGDALVNISH